MITSEGKGEDSTHNLKNQAVKSTKKLRSHRTEDQTSAIIIGTTTRQHQKVKTKINKGSRLHKIIRAAMITTTKAIQ